MDMLKRYPPLYTQEIMGSFVTRPSINFEDNLDFSCDAMVYLEKLENRGIIHNNSAYELVIKGIKEFIECSLILGYLYHWAKKHHINIIKSICQTEFWIRYTVTNGPKVESDSIRVSITTQRDEQVNIRINSSSLNVPLKTFLIFDCSGVIYPEGSDEIDFVRIPGSCSYEIKDRVFKRPYFKRLPLYINTPFIREYAREQYKNPTPVLEYRYHPYKSSFFI